MVSGAVQIIGGRIAAVRSSAPRGGETLDLRGAYVAPGFIDLHVWGDPSVVARDAARHGTTAFLATLGPAPPAQLSAALGDRTRKNRAGLWAECLGVHLEGPFVNRARGGALPTRWMRAPTIAELAKLAAAARGRLKLITVAPELPGALEAIRWCVKRRIAVSLGHSDAGTAVAIRAVEAGASAVTHVFNGMRPFHHRAPSLVDVALGEPRLTTMAILDGVHMVPQAFRLLYRMKGASGIALVTDSIQRQGWKVIARRGAYYTRTGVLAGSRLTMLRAVHNAVQMGAVPLVDAVRMASETPARLLGLERGRGQLVPGGRADLVAFDRRFKTLLAVVGGRIVYQKGR